MGREKGGQRARLLSFSWGTQKLDLNGKCHPASPISQPPGGFPPCGSGPGRCRGKAGWLGRGLASLLWSLLPLWSRAGERLVQQNPPPPPALQPTPPHPPGTADSCGARKPQKTVSGMPSWEAGKRSPQARAHHGDFQNCPSPPLSGRAGWGHRGQVAFSRPLR